MRLLGGMIMRHGAVGVIGGNGRKTGADEIWAARARRRDLLVYGELGDAFFSLGCFEPRKELAQCRAVLPHSAAPRLDFGGALARLSHMRSVGRFAALSRAP